jgi:hypothetical protein
VVAAEVELGVEADIREEVGRTSFPARLFERGDETATRLADERARAESP